MRPLRRSFLLALFTLAVCRAADHPKLKDASPTPSSTFSPALILPTPNSQQGTSSQPLPSFSGSSSSTFSPSLTPSSTPSSTSTTLTSSSHTTTSTTPTETSTTSPSTSTSSSSSQTQSTSSSTSSLPSSPTSDVTPAATLIVPDPNSFATSTSSSDGPGPTTDVSSSSATSSTSFWDNKSAVAGAFVTVALALLVLVAGIAYMVFRRRQQRKLERAMEAEDFVDRGDVEDPYDTRGVSPTPSITQMTMPSHAEAFVSRDIHFGASYVDFAGHGLDYPPAAAPPNNAGRAGWGLAYPAAGNVPHRPGVGSSGLLSPPSNSRQPGRESVATYDSFYGGIDRGHGQAI